MRAAYFLCLLLLGCGDEQPKQQAHKPACTEVKEGRVLGYIVNIGTGEWIPCREQKEN